MCSNFPNAHCSLKHCLKGQHDKRQARLARKDTQKRSLAAILALQPITSISMTDRPRLLSCQPRCVLNIFQTIGNSVKAKYQYQPQTNPVNRLVIKKKTDNYLKNRSASWKNTNHLDHKVLFFLRVKHIHYFKINQKPLNILINKTNNSKTNRLISTSFINQHSAQHKSVFKSKFP